MIANSVYLRERERENERTNERMIYSEGLWPILKGVNITLISRIINNEHNGKYIQCYLQYDTMTAESSSLTQY